MQLIDVEIVNDAAAIVNASHLLNELYRLYVERLKHDLHLEDEDAVDCCGHGTFVGKTDFAVDDEKDGSERMEGRSDLKNCHLSPQREELPGWSLVWPASEDPALSFAFDALEFVQAASYSKVL